MLTNAIFTSTDEEDDLFEGLNGYRSSSNLPNFTENSNAACLAEKIADKLDALSCENAFDYSSAPGNSDYKNFTLKFYKSDDIMFVLLTLEIKKKSYYSLQC